MLRSVGFIRGLGLRACAARRAWVCAMLLFMPFCGSIEAQNLFLHDPPKSVQIQGQVDSRILYLLSFARDLQWPQPYKTVNFYIEVVGKPTPFSLELERAAQGYMVGGRAIQVKHTASWSDRSSFHRPDIVVVQRSAKAYLPMIQKFFQGYPVLVVCNFPDFNDGWMVSFFEREGNSELSDVALSVDNIEGSAGIIVPNFLKRRGAGFDTKPGNEQQVARQIKRLESLVASRDAQIASQQENIRIQQDTIARQQQMIIDLRHDVARYEVSRLYIPYFDLPSLQDENSERPSVGDVSHASSSDSLFKNDFSGTLTAPWGAGWTGHIILILMGLTSSACAFLVSFLIRKAGSRVTANVRGSVSGTSSPLNPTPNSAGILLGVALAREREEESTAPGSVQPSSKPIPHPRVPSEEFRAVVGEGHPGDSYVEWRVTEETSRVKRVLLSNISHELRTPLNAIVSLAQYVGENTSADVSVRESMGIINQSAFELERMIGNVITQSQLQTGDILLEKTSFSIRDMLSRVHRLAEQHLEIRGRASDLLLRMRMDGDPWERFTGDQEKLVHVFELLILLAVGGMDRGIVEFGCRVDSMVASSSQPKDVLRFFVMDRCRDGGWSVADLRDLFSQGQHRWEDMASLDVVVGLLALMGTELEESWTEGWHQVSFTL